MVISNEDAFAYYSFVDPQIDTNLEIDWNTAMIEANKEAMLQKAAEEEEEEARKLKEMEEKAEAVRLEKQ